MRTKALVVGSEGNIDALVRTPFEGVPAVQNVKALLYPVQTDGTDTIWCIVA